jgi:hypothetical protein
MNEMQRRIEEMKRDFFSADEKVVLTALSACREIGDHSVVLPLLSLFAKTESDNVKAQVSDMLSNLKVSNTEESFMEALADPAFLDIRKEILGFMWNSGLQPVEHLTELVQLATESGFEEIVECLSLVESMDGPFPEDEVEQSGYVLRDWISQNKDDERMALMLEFLKVVEALPVDFGLEDE